LGLRKLIAKSAEFILEEEGLELFLIIVGVGIGYLCQALFGISDFIVFIVIAVVVISPLIILLLDKILKKIEESEELRFAIEHSLIRGLAVLFLAAGIGSAVCVVMLRYWDKSQLYEQIRTHYTYILFGFILIFILACASPFLKLLVERKSLKQDKGGGDMEKKPVVYTSEDEELTKMREGEGVESVIFSQERMIRDLLLAVDDPKLFSRKVRIWRKVAQTKDQIKVLESIKELVERNTEIVRTFIENQRVLIEAKNIMELEQLIWERRKEEERRKLEEERLKRAELRKKALEMLRPEKRDEILEEIRRVVDKMRVMRAKMRSVAELVEYKHLIERQIKLEYPPEEAEIIIDEFERTLVEEGIIGEV